MSRVAGDGDAVAGFLASAYLPPGIDVSDLAPRIRVPTLVVHGSEDAAVPVELGRQLASLIPGARFHLEPGGGHVASDAESDQNSIRAILDFLSEDSW